MSAKNTGWVITNGKHYVSTESYSAFTPEVNKARFWKKEQSAQNILKSLATRKKAPISGFYVIFIGVNTKIDTVTVKPIETVETPQTSNFQSDVCAQMEKAQIATNIKEFLSEVLGDNAYTREIVGMHFYHSPKNDEESHVFSLSDIQTALAVMRDLSNPNIQAILCKELSRVDMEIVDIEHKIEMTNFNAYDGYKLAKEMQVARRKRREIKDTLEMIDAIIGRQSTADIHNIINAVETKHAQRTYTPRVRDDLFSTKK